MKKTDYKAMWKPYKRSFALWNKYCPGLPRNIVLSNALTEAAPYVTVYLSAQVLTALAAGQCNVWQLIILTLAVTFALHCLSSVLERRVQAQNSMLFPAFCRMLGEKFGSMDFADAEGREARDLADQIWQYAMYGNFGICASVEVVRRGTKGVVSLLCGVGLSVTLFTRQVPAGTLTFLNSPLFIPLIAAMLLGAAVLSGKLSGAPARESTRSTEDATLSNRMFNVYCCFACDNKELALDIRIYRQDEIAQFYAAEDTLYSPSGKMARAFRGIVGLSAGAGQGLSGILSGLVYLFVCLKAYGGAFGIGAVTQYVGAITGAFSALSELMAVLAYAKENTKFLEMMYKFLDIPHRMYQGSLTTEKRSDRQYEVEFRDVSFRYPGSDRYALRHVNVKFRVGETLAVVGPNGSGKTTFIKLLCRLYDPDEGEILLNGIDIRKYRYDDYMDIFSVVFQDFTLFALPLGENVASGRSVDAARAENALRMAGFGGRLDSLPKGLETPLYKDLDKDGVDVSGGEAQKIAIARALYRDSAFLILDEPTAALDPRAESEIYSRLNDIVSDKTAIYISHRLSSCRFCDEIMVFDNGSIVQKGTHEKLLEDEAGLYRRLWDAQAQYYTESA